MDRLKKIWIGIAVLLAAAGAFLFYKNHIASNPGSRLVTYMELLDEGRYDEMYDMLDKASQKSISKKDFIRRNRNIYEGISMKNLEVEVTTKKREENVGYQVHMDTSAGEISYQTETKFVKEKGSYRMCWDDSVIFPDLTAEDKVRVEVLHAQRGTITDKNGNLLAGEGKIDSVGIVPGKMDNNTISRMAAILDMDKKEIQKDLDQTWVTDESFVPVCKMDRYPKELLSVAGVMVSKTTERIYPMGEAAAHLIGYVQDGEGKAGLEKLYDGTLKGRDGRRITIQDKNGRVKKKLAVKAEEDGENIQTTIDSSLQKALYDQFKDDKSAHAAMNPKTGEILALVSTPSYDGEALSWGMSQEQWNELSKDPDHPMQNRWKGTWCPGSSIKPIIGAIGVTEGKFTADEDFGDSGTRWQKDKSWGGYFVTTLHNYKKHNLSNALIYSDNIYFAKAALKIGKEVLTQKLNDIGFGEKVPFEFGLTESSYGGSGGFETEVQLADSGYGQGKMMVNPIHMLSIYSAFSNDGNMLRPRLVKAKNSGKKVWKSKVFSQKAVKEIKSAMKLVVEDPNGTAHAVKIAKLDIAGKTGTAEIKESKEDTKGTELGWFVTFTGKNGGDDTVEMVSMTEDVKGRGGSGYVVDKTKKVLEAYMQN